MLATRIIIASLIGVSALIGGLWALDEYGDRRVATALSERDAEDERKRLALEAAARIAGAEAEAARRSAQRPGAIARLMKDWCRDCQGGTQ